MDRRQYEYEITVHSEDSFHELVYFCTATGECTTETAPVEMTRVLGEQLNSRGHEGWELVQITFSSGGVVAFWKREIL